jgi:glycosyltransferase involved in cell wall biosynthesis
MNYSILLLSRYARKGPSSRVRHYNYLPFLERAGFRVTSAPFLGEDYLERLFRGERRSPQLLIKAFWRRLRQVATARQYDLIWVEKEALPWLPALWELAFLGGRPVVTDFDDPWHLRYATHRNPLVRLVLEHKLETVVTRAKAVTVGSSMLANWAKASGASPVIELPVSVDIDRYPILPLPDGSFTIGWIGTPMNEAYLALVAEPLRRLHAACGARVRLIGGSGHFSLPGVAIDQVPWSEDTEAEELARCHVGIMPLRDGPWERGKCGYKLIQYMAAARPAVASPLGASTSILLPEETGLFANDTEGWTAALTALATDRERARKLGLAARQRAESKYSLQLSAQTLIKILQEAVASGQTNGTRPRPRWR